VELFRYFGFSLLNSSCWIFLLVFHDSLDSVDSVDKIFKNVWLNLSVWDRRGGGWRGGGEIDSVFVYKNMGLIWNVETRLDPGVPTVQHLQNKYKTNSSNFIRTKYRIFNLIYLMYLTKLKNCIVGINSNAPPLKIRGYEQFSLSL